MFAVLHLLAIAGLVLAQNEVCHPPCGCFSMDDPWDEWLEPESPEYLEITWELFSLSNPVDPIVFNATSGIPEEYDPAKPTKFIIHGWNGLSSVMYGVRDAFLDSGMDYNVIVMDWGGNINYLQSAANVRTVGACTEYIARTMVDGRGGRWQDMHCIGHSLGAQSCGQMGLAANGRVGRITGLDPAGPSFDTDDNRVRLDKTDGDYVDVLHTNGNSWINLGLGRPIGHVDFFPNKGGEQPPCDGSTCDHLICVDYYIISITQECDYNAFPCQTDEDADAGACETCVTGVDCQLMGYFATTMPGTGSYFLRTVEDYPYCET